MGHAPSVPGHAGTLGACPTALLYALGRDGTGKVQARKAFARARLPPPDPSSFVAIPRFHHLRESFVDLSELALGTNSIGSRGEQEPVTLFVGGRCDHDRRAAKLTDEL